MSTQLQLDLSVPAPVDPVRALLRQAGVDFALGHGTFSSGGTGCVAALTPGRLLGWKVLCHRYSRFLEAPRASKRALRRMTAESDSIRRRYAPAMQAWVEAGRGPRYPY